MDHGTDDTSTTAGPSSSDETTVVPNTSVTDAAELAWSADDAPDIPEHSGRRPLPRMLISLLTGVAVGGIALGAFVLGRHFTVPATNRAPTAMPAPPAAPVAPEPSPAPVAVPAPSPPPATPPPASPTPTPVQAAPTYAPPPPQQPGPGSDADQRFLALASQIPGITITEPEAGTTSARAVCRGLRGGKTPAEEAVATANNTGLTPEHAAALVTAAITVYCPRYGG